MTQSSTTNPKTKFATPILILIGGLSAFNLLNYGTNLINLSCLTSLIGLTATVLYFSKIDAYKVMVYIWTFPQVVAINKTIFDSATNLSYNSTIFDVSQVYNINFGLDLGLESGELNIGFNVLSLILIVFLKGLPKTLKEVTNEDN